jgi:hemerythrin-like domain-containing protein
MVDPISVWHGDHIHFSRLLDAFEQQMLAFHAGRNPDYELMRDIVHYLHHYADRYHHPREDVAFTRLVARNADFQLGVNRLLQEHRVIGVAGELLLKYLEDILEETVIERKAVEAAAATYLVYYRHHLATEQGDVLPRAAWSLTDEDWAAVAQAVPSGPDPLFGNDVAGRYRDLRERIMRAGLPGPTLEDGVMPGAMVHG